MSILKLLVVEGNTKEENSNFNKAGCVPQSENFKQHIKMFEPNCEINIVEPGDDSAISKIIDSLKKYDGIILTGSTLRIDDFSNEVKKHIDFAKTCFKHEKKIFAACWGLQITVNAAGGKCRVAPSGPHVGIAYDIELTNEGKKHKLYSSKPHKFTTPAFNYDEVEIPPNNAVVLASNKINKFEALHFTVGNSEIWGLQYHPEIPYDYMIKLIKHRSKKLIDNKSFKNETEINQHISLIEKAKVQLKDDIRLLELKNWINYLKENN
ncbi:MAG: type 1 glutamine amidotransferase [Pelagibacteraceae bacterium]|jgi:GMP synthase (glutamine-hydrolysing)|uniref:Putative glutamine amidotransferase class-I n=1 Tax=uncultured marine microorganism HF4000_001B09 TaxID=455502 RepID=B3T016_9ZZZZ|nr:putative glutamine amidotransferase class-I [uncultured marine microorganism HF4000_001B09]MBL4626050.1 type 1 glutamine amidotransferase [Pelagibacteraceae bacterium]MCH2377215.1 type 1 glutamine amidotransferase [Pelagibacterales bacterium]RUA13859.1 MAG: type 1 glutamine amidotransferase [Alphaproteobacteria bacterium]RUA16709.1 MAG: type 1 glutamine amidotransferase [Alphaproteobacteria bacterium]